MPQVAGEEDHRHPPVPEFALDLVSLVHRAGESRRDRRAVPRLHERARREGQTSECSRSDRERVARWRAVRRAGARPIALCVGSAGGAGGSIGFR